MTSPPALSSWHHDWSSLPVAVIGLGARGFAVADTLIELGARVTVYSRGDHSPDHQELLEILGAALVVVPEGRDLHEQDVPGLVVTTADDDDAHPVLGRALTAGIPVWSDLELAWRVRDKTGTPAPWLLVAGSASPERVSRLSEAMLLADGRRSMACGAAPASVPVLDAIRTPDPWDSLVVATTASALRHSSSVAAWSSVSLDGGASTDSSLDPDLALVYERTRTACLFHHSHPATMRMVEDADVEDGCRAIGIGLGVPGPSDFGIVEGILCDRAFLDDRRSTALEFATLDMLDEVGLVGPDAASDVLVAAALARSLDVSIAAVNAALRASHHPL